MDTGPSSKKKVEGKSNKDQNSGWIQAGDVLLSSTERGEAEILFEAIEEINKKIQSLEKFRATLQQIERIGPGKNVNYIIYIKDDVPKKIVVRNKSNGQDNENFSFAADFTVEALQH